MLNQLPVLPGHTISSAWNYLQITGPYGSTGGILPGTNVTLLAQSCSSYTDQSASLLPSKTFNTITTEKKKIIQIFSTDSSEEHFSEIFENKSVKLLKFQNIEETASVEHLKPKT